MLAAQWIDRVKLTRGWDSDYRVSKELSLSKQAVSDYRHKGKTFDENTAIKVATALGERPEAIILDQAAERVKSPEVRAALLDAARRLCILCKVDSTPKMRARYARRVSAAACFH